MGQISFFSDFVIVATDSLCQFSYDRLFEDDLADLRQKVLQWFYHPLLCVEKTIAALFVADRLDHLQNPVNGLLKKLEEGFTVITDRYYFSSYAYHGAHMPLEWVIQSNALSADLLRPDLNIFIDIPPQVGFDRVHANRADIEIYETLDNISKVYDTYQTAFELLKEEEKIVSVDGNRSQEEVSDELFGIVSALLEA